MDRKELELLIPSETVRNYILETGWAFTDKEKAALVCFVRRPWEEERSLLRTIGDKTSDQELREQITAYLKWGEQAEEAFKKNTDRNSVYILKVEEQGGYWDGEYLPRGYFSDWETALRYGKKEQLPFQIDKYLVDHVSEFEDGTCSQCEIGFLRFDKDGNLRCISSNEIPDVCDTIAESSKHFSEMYFEIPNPFEKGDIVRFHDGNYGIVDVSQKEWKEIVSKNKRLQSNYHNKDVSDIILWVSVLKEDGTFEIGEATPLELERYQPKDLSDPLDMLLDTASCATRGECSLGVLLRQIEEYQKSING